MKKMTRMVLISAVFVTSGLTAKIATENYKAVVTNDERIHTAHENLKKPNKAAVLETIVDATNAESEERIQNAVIIEPEEPKVVRIKNKVTTSAGVSPIASVMDKRTINKAEEFIEKIVHPAEVVVEKNLDFTTENIPIQELKYEANDIFPTFEELVEEIQLTYKIILPEITSEGAAYDKTGENIYFFDIDGTKEADGKTLNCIYTYYGSWYTHCHMFSTSIIKDNSAIVGGINICFVEGYTNIVEFNPDTRTLDYSSLASSKDSNEWGNASFFWEEGYDRPTTKQLYDFLAGVETGKYPLLTGITDITFK